ncbi:MAG: metal ABC transporter substrate-binding protein [candidate division WOR-3 bacterium]
MRHVVRFLLLAVLVGCAARPTSRMRVVASTANIGAIVAALGGNRVQVTTIAPTGMCPGHFDIRPSDVVAANEAKLLINQGWEQWFPKLLEAVANPTVTTVTCTTQGNWMVPPVHVKAVAELAGLLARADSAGARDYAAAATGYSARVESTANEVKGMFRGRILPVVIASSHQAPFLSWLGFRVVATYGRPEEFTARELTRLASVAVDSGVGLVVDNLQSGSDAGKPLAEALRVPQVTLTNFPGTEGYVQTLTANAAALSRVLQ